MTSTTGIELTGRVESESWPAQVAALHAEVARLVAAPRSESGHPTARGGEPAQTIPAPQGVSSHGPAPLSAEGLRARMLGMRRGHVSLPEGLRHLHGAASGLDGARVVLGRMHGAVTQAACGRLTAEQASLTHKFVGRCRQDLEGAAELARSRTLALLAGSATAWALPGAGARLCPHPGAGSAQLREQAPALAMPSGLPAEAVGTLALIVAADALLVRELEELRAVRKGLRGGLVHLLDHARTDAPGEVGLDGRLAPGLELITVVGARAVVAATQAQFRAIGSLLGASAS